MSLSDMITVALLVLSVPLTAVTYAWWSCRAGVPKLREGKMANDDDIVTQLRKIRTRLDFIEMENAYLRNRKRAARMIRQAASLGLPEYKWFEGARFGLVNPQGDDRSWSLAEFDRMLVEAAGRKHLEECGK